MFRVNSLPYSFSTYSSSLSAGKTMLDSGVSIGHIVLLLVAPPVAVSFLSLNQSVALNYLPCRVVSALSFSSNLLLFVCLRLLSRKSLSQLRGLCYRPHFNYYRHCAVVTIHKAEDALPLLAVRLALLLPLLRPAAEEESEDAADLRLLPARGAGAGDDADAIDDAADASPRITPSSSEVSSASFKATDAPEPARGRGAAEVDDAATVPAAVASIVREADELPLVFSSCCGNIDGTAVTAAAAPAET